MHGVTCEIWKHRTQRNRVDGAYHKDGFYHKKGLGMLKQNSYNVDYYADGTRSTCPNGKIYC